MRHEKSISRKVRKPWKGEEKNPISRREAAKKGFFGGSAEASVERERRKKKVLQGVMINQETQCWQWLRGKTNKGYGAVYFSGVQFSVHSVMYMIYKGRIPDGLDLDHLCRNRSCCNPDHLEAVTRKENLLRGLTIAASNFKVSRCPRGHPYSEENTIRRRGGRECRECSRVLAKAYYQARKHDPIFLAKKRKISTKSYNKLKSSTL